MSTPQAIPNAAAPRAGSDSAADLLNVEDRLQEEIRLLAAINQELLGKAPPVSPQASATEEPDEVARLRTENSQLRARVEELEQVLQTAAPNEEMWLERQKEYETLLEEKSEVIRTLHLRAQEQSEGSGARAEAAADNGDVQSLKKQLEEQRRQLEEDEESLMQQMRQMEMAMSKDRAELARQRNEIQRLHSELNHEIENASRDPGLRERLVALQRLQGEVTGRKPAATAQPAPKAPAPKPPAPVSAAAPTPEKKKNSGLLSRIFGK